MTRLSLVTTFASMVLFGAFAAPASAAIIQADFRVELGFFERPERARVFENLAASVGAGDELNLSHQIANPSGYSGGLIVDLDPIAQTLTITGADPFSDYPVPGMFTANFEFVNLSITNIIFDGVEGIADLALLSDNLLRDAYGAGYTFDSSFTDNSISLSWFNLDNEILVEDQSSSVLSFTTSAEPAEVPEPSSVLLLGAGLAGLGLLRRGKANSR